MVKQTQAAAPSVRLRGEQQAAFWALQAGCQLEHSETCSRCRKLERALDNKNGRGG